MWCHVGYLDPATTIQNSQEKKRNISHKRHSTRNDKRLQNTQPKCIAQHKQQQRRRQRPERRGWEHEQEQQQEQQWRRLRSCARSCRRLCQAQQQSGFPVRICWVLRPSMIHDYVRLTPNLSRYLEKIFSQNAPHYAPLGLGLPRHPAACNERCFTQEHGQTDKPGTTGSSPAKCATPISLNSLTF